MTQEQNSKTSTCNRCGGAGTILRFSEQGWAHEYVDCPDCSLNSRQDTASSNVGGWVQSTLTDSGGSSTVSDDEPYENTFSPEEARRELRRAWDLEHDLRRALRNLPEVPSYAALLFLSGASKWPDDWETGKRMQRDLGSSAIPFKTECESGAGLWSRIRNALLEPSNE